MSAAVLHVAGWALATAAALLLLLAHRRDAVRRERVARASHELRGPLQAALLALHPLRSQAPPEHVDAVELALRRAIVALADLDIAPAGGRAPAHAASVDLEVLVQRQAGTWRALARIEGRELRIRSAPGRGVARVHGDAGRLTQAASILVANALEHGAGPVDVVLRGAPGGRVALEVRDAGAGLPAPVATLAARARGGRGRRGRGLAIARDIAAAHGGRLAAAPSARGARLVLELPMAPAHASAAAEDGS